MTSRAIIRVVCLWVLAIGMFASPTPAQANETVLVCDIYGDHVVPQPSGLYGIGTNLACPGNDDPSSYTLSTPPGGMSIWTGANNTISHGTAVHWTVSAPQGLTISSVYIPHMWSQGIDDNTDWGGGFYWAGGNVSTFDGETGWSSATTSGPKFTWPGSSPYFGWQVVCGVSQCKNGGAQWLSVELLELNMQETSGPYLDSPNGLWQSSGWIRGVWPIHFYGDSPSGLCAMSASLNGQGVAKSTSGSAAAVWHQCSAPSVDQGVNTAQYGQGALPLTLGAIDAANVPVSYTKLVYVDNQTPTITLSGPTDAPSSAGTQYVSASAGAGPSGVAGISCSEDGAPSRWYPGASTEIPVQGAGPHTVTCFSESNARDAAGSPAASSSASWTLNIRAPTVSALSFTRVIDALRCRRVSEVVRIPAHWVTASYHGHPVRTKLPAETRSITVVRCHPRVVYRRVRVDGHWRRVRIAVLPRTVMRNNKYVRPGASTTVSGWLGTASGNALGSRAVRVLAAPDNGSRQFTQVALVTTAADGSWSVRLPPGPSRLVTAQYDGGSNTEPAESALVRVIVPASVTLSLSPARTHWGGQITISGRLAGGYIPPAGELVILWVGWPGGATEIGHLYSGSDGRFSTRYTFLRGNGTETYRLWAASAKESDYPYAPGRSRRARVTVTS